MGDRVNKLTDTQRMTFLTELDAGETITAAARKAGTSKGKIGRAVAAAQKAEAQLVSGEREHEDLEDWEVWCIGLLVDMEKAEGAFERAVIDIIKDAAKKDWRAGAWIAERRWPERWAKRAVEAKPSIGQVGVLVMGDGGAGPVVGEDVLATAQRMMELANAVNEPVPDPAAEEGDIIDTFLVETPAEVTAELEPAYDFDELGI